MIMRGPACVLAAGLLFGAEVGAQSPLLRDVAPTSSQPAAETTDARDWSLSASVYTYVVPDDRNYVQPGFTADRGWLHLEGRYNYENIETGSAWVGYNFTGGQDVTWELTPMLGGVFGETAGVAPGYKASVSVWKVELYSEGEYVFDRGTTSDSFFYNWSEVSLAPADWFRVGLMAQRTRAFEAERDIQRGVLVGLTFKRTQLTGYVLNPGRDAPTFVFAVGVDF
jgi:hypothetical protein